MDTALLGLSTMTQDVDLSSEAGALNLPLITLPVTDSGAATLDWDRGVGMDDDITVGTDRFVLGCPTAAVVSGKSPWSDEGGSAGHVILLGHASCSFRLEWFFLFH